MSNTEGSSATMKWEKLADCPLKTENFGKSGYIYQDGKAWMSVIIYEGGAEYDTPCRTKAEAKQVVEIEARSEE